MNPLWILAAFAVAAAAYLGGAVLIPLACALFLAVLLEPFVAWCENKGLRRGRSAVLVVLLFLMAVGTAIWGCSQPFSRIVADLPQYSAKIRAGVSALERRARNSDTGALVHRALRSGGPPGQGGGSSDGFNSWSQFFWRGLGSFFEAAGIAAFVPFLIIVLLSEKETLIEGFKRLAGSSCDIGLIDRETTQMVRAYFYGNVAAGAGMAFMHWLVFAGLGLKNPIGLGLVTGLLTLVPLIGLPAALVLPTAQALLQFHGALPFAVLAASMTALHLLNANYLIPRFVGGSVKINAAAATVGLLFWGWMWGVTGFVLAVPLTALIKVLLESNRNAAAYAGLLAEKPRAPRRHWFGRRWHRTSARPGTEELRS
jgi:predicted PurR-regulated permease PerM